MSAVDDTSMQLRWYSNLLHKVVRHVHVRALDRHLFVSSLSPFREYIACHLFVSSLSPFRE